MLCVSDINVWIGFTANTETRTVTDRTDEDGENSPAYRETSTDRITLIEEESSIGD